MSQEYLLVRCGGLVLHQTSATEEEALLLSIHRHHHRRPLVEKLHALYPQHLYKYDGKKDGSVDLVMEPLVRLSSRKVIENDAHYRHPRQVDLY